MRESAQVSTSGFGCLGAILACVLSVALNHSAVWAVIHTFFGWFYILYALVLRAPEIAPALRAMFNV